MADLDFFFDPVCPWAWITSRWVSEVQQLRSYDVQWKFISLKFLNEDKMDYSKMPDGYKDVHAAGTNGLRVAARARAEQGNEAVVLCTRRSVQAFIRIKSVRSLWQILSHTSHRS